jgi:hypothetical protein
MHARQFHRPRGRAGVEAGLAYALERARQVHRADAPRQQIRQTCERTTPQSREEGTFAPLAIRQAADKWPAAQRHHGKRADDQPHGPVGGSQFVPYVRRKTGQNSPKSQESEEGCGDQAPESPAK